MFRISVGDYEVCCQADGLPEMLPENQKRASLSEHFGDEEADSSVCYVSVGLPQRWPTLVVTQHYSPAGFGFVPGVLLVPEIHRLYVGAGRRLLCYDLSRPVRLWEDEAEAGFWSWSRHGSVVLMAAELELAAWDEGGEKLWTRFVEPPWEFSVTGEVVSVDVMDVVSCVQIRSGQRLTPN